MGRAPASSRARAEYEQEYRDDYESARSEWEADRQNDMNRYRTLMEKWKMGAKV